MSQEIYKPSILVAEKGEEIKHLLSPSYTVKSVHTGLEALGEYRRHRDGLVIPRYRLLVAMQDIPSLDGIGLSVYIRKYEKDFPIILIHPDFSNPRIAETARKGICIDHPIPNLGGLVELVNSVSKVRSD